ncbi:MAG TPA: site-specific integrase [Pyrinomonadaceae bacterium]
MKANAARKKVGKRAGNAVFDTSPYDRNPELTEAESRAIKTALKQREINSQRWLLKYGHELERLLQPVRDAIRFTGSTKRHHEVGIRARLLKAMDALGKSYWAFSETEWVLVVGKDLADYRQNSATSASGRCFLLAFGYLAGRVRAGNEFGSFSTTVVARKVFGAGVVTESIKRVQDEMLRLGYCGKLVRKRVPNSICKVFLACGSARTEDITLDVLENVRNHSPSELTRRTIVPLSRALFALGILPDPLKPYIPVGWPENSAAVGVPEKWWEWIRRWHDTTTVEPSTKRQSFYSLTKAGRWINKNHPELADPAKWTRANAAEYVAALMSSKVGEWAVPNRAHNNSRGKPLAPRTVAHNLNAMRSFFRECQEWEWIERRFNPGRAFESPTSIKVKLAPDPRVIADDVWAKLLWAGLNLTLEDLPCNMRSNRREERIPYYPLEMVRAVAAVWLLTALRAGEIVRLRVGCVRWQHEDVRIPEIEEVLEKEAVCWLHVPVNKTKHAFTKPVDPPAGKAVEAWERVRPEQKPELDDKTNEVVHFLFSYRGKILSKAYINGTLIPILCRKANIPESDSRGVITSHRGRATIVTQLFNAKDPMSLSELQEWVGHRTPQSTQYYAKVRPTKLAKKFADARYFERNVRTIEVLIDRDAVISGAAARGEPWQYFDLGHGWCTHAFFIDCPHRLACPKCQFYVPKDSAKGQLIEGQANLQQMLQRIPLTDDERAAVEEGMEVFESLCQRLADVPTPAGPTPRELVQLRRTGKEDS